MEMQHLLVKVVVAECFAMSGLPGHNIGGTIHIIVNNQIGFTTAQDLQDHLHILLMLQKLLKLQFFMLMEMIQKQLFIAAKIATEYRQKFNRDVVIDIVCYRRFGHNEGDEPSFTQPLMYKKIKSHPSTLKFMEKN